MVTCSSLLLIGRLTLRANYQARLGFPRIREEKRREHNITKQNRIEGRRMSTVAQPHAIIDRSQRQSAPKTPSPHLPWLTTRFSSFPLSKIESNAALARASTSIRFSPPSAALQNQSEKKQAPPSIHRRDRNASNRNGRRISADKDFARQARGEVGVKPKSNKPNASR